MYEAGIPQNPVLITIDGESYYVFRDRSIMVNGKPMRELILEPFDWVIARRGWTRDDLNFEYSEMGTITRRFNESEVIELSSNPEKPVWLLMRSVDGEKINWSNPKLRPLVNLVEENIRKDERIATLELEIAYLRDENRKFISLTKEKKKELEEVFKGKEEMVVPKGFESLTLKPEGK